MKKFISKFKMKTLIIILSILANVFTLMIGAQGINLIKRSNVDMEYMYGYAYWTALVDQIRFDVSQIETDFFKCLDEYNSVYEEHMIERNAVIQINYDEYVNSETESDEEEAYVTNIGIYYDEFYTEVIELMERLKNGELVDQISKDKVNELQEKLDDEIIGLADYLLEWAASDKEASDTNNTVQQRIYIGVMLGCVAVFIIISTLIVIALSKQVREISEALEEVAEGNLDVRLEHNGNNEFDHIKEYINKTIESITTVIKSLKSNSSVIDEKAEGLSSVSDEVTSSVKNMSVALDNVANGTNVQAEDMIKIISVLEEFSKVVVNFTNNIEHLEQNSNLILERANLSTEKMDALSSDSKQVGIVVQEFTNKLNSLNKSIEEISSITNLINDIAEQTNLLALNAAIESARVGEAGKGFAVVADEIRQLAEQSKASANSIATLIEDVEKETVIIMNEGNGVNDKLYGSGIEIKNTITLFAEIIKHINELVPKIRELSDAADIINKQKNDIYGKVENSSAIAEEIASSTEEVLASLNQINSGSKYVSDTANNLSELTNELDKEIKVFKTE